MLQQSCGWFDKLTFNHIIKHSANSKESLSSHAKIFKPVVIHQNLLDDKRGYSLAKISSSFHNPQTKGDYFRLKQEIDNVWVVNFNQSTHNSQRSKPQVFERSALAYGVQERVQEQWDMSLKKKFSGVFVTGHAL